VKRKKGEKCKEQKRSTGGPEPSGKKNASSGKKPTKKKSMNEVKKQKNQLSEAPKEGHSIGLKSRNNQK